MKLGRFDQARLTADRAGLYADLSGSPLVSAAAARELAIVLRHQNQAETAQRLVLRAASAVKATGQTEPERGPGDPDGVRAVQPPWPALPIGPTCTGVPEPSVTGREAAPGQSRVTDLVSFGGVTTRPVTRAPEPPESLTG